MTEMNVFEECNEKQNVPEDYQHITVMMIF